MKFRLYSILFAAALTGSSAFAQTLKAHASVPFEFRVGNTVLPAGDYQISESRDLLTVSQTTGKHTIMHLTLPASRRTVTPDAKLQFTRFGDEYFLTNIWSGGSHEGRGISPTKHETALAQTFGEVETASISLHPVFQ